MKIILASLLLVVTVYTITAVFGYFSFFNHVNAEFLLMFEYLKMDSASTEIQVVVAKVRIKSPLKSLIHLLSS